MPLFIAAFLPKQLISGINEYFMDENQDASVYTEIKDEEKAKNVDLEVFIHLKEKGFESLGHVDMCYKGIVYSYGCYDKRADRLGGFISDGTMAVAPRESYIEHCIQFEHKALVVYGIILSSEQRKAVEKELEDFKSLFVPWKSDLQKKEDNELTNEQLKQYDYHDPASELYKATGATIHKISSGPFKKYFALSTNCVQLADKITGAAGLDSLSVKGVITPGNYYSLINHMFERKNTIVVTRTFYKKSDVEES